MKLSNFQFVKTGKDPINKRNVLFATVDVLPLFGKKMQKLIALEENSRNWIFVDTGLHRPETQPEDMYKSWKLIKAFAGEEI